MPQRLKSLIAHAVAAALVASSTAPVHAQLPSLGDAGAMTVNAERRLGDQISREIHRDPTRIDDPILEDYVRDIWQPLLGASRTLGEMTADQDSRYAWQVFLFRDRTINAFALPGGYFGLHLGLIRIVDTRDELAAVLGHELSHVTQRHIARMMESSSRAAPLMIAAMILGALAAGSSRNTSDLGMAAIAGSQALAIQNQLNFSRDMEREADRIGFNTMLKAGFNPRAVASLFEKMQAANRINDTGNFPYLRSHPLTTERIGSAQQRIQLDTGRLPPLQADPLALMMAARADVLLDPGIDVLRNLIARAQGNALDSLSAPQRAGALYGAALAQARLRQFGPAGELMRQLDQTLANLRGNSTRHDELVMVAGKQLAAEIALLQGDAPRALTLVDLQSNDRADLLLAAQAGVRAGQAQAVSQRLQSWVAAHPRDTAARRQLAVALHAQNQHLRALRSEAEASVVELDYTAALDRLRAAQDLVRGEQGRADYIESSIIDTRTREVQELLRQQTLDDRVNQ
ncbi:MAG: Beta-barrel assembly-enhancing protease [Paracidovorax wautersii]|uniref:Beta-barrel assembly-enhancing protease n=1 Tax=Paracidovorax wautersii TaxID=1177982 RepID=A0A7V8FLM3_9BURK|nr:MAG: Beta-barrel assembly-enhancing protease [Paracidovorax wautersii]